MNPSKKAWEVPALRSETVQETLVQSACAIKLSISVRVGDKPHGGQGVDAQALFS